MEKLLRKSRVLLGNICVALFIWSIVARFTTSYNPAIDPKHISSLMFRISFILFSINMMITIILDNSKQSKKSANRAEKIRRVA